MNLRSIDLNLLVVFDAVYRTGNISIAAKQIGMSQPAMSNALARFRDAMDDPLFARQPHGVSPTLKAQQLAPAIRQALTILQSTLAAPGSYNYASDTETFTMAMEELSEIVLLPKLISWLRQVAPGMRITVSPEMGPPARKEMRRGDIDISVEYIKEDQLKDFEVRHLFDEDRVCVVRKDHKTVGNTISLKKYLDTPHVILNQRLRGVTTVNSFLASKGWERNVAMQIPGYLSAPMVLQRTDLIATMPRRVAKHLTDIYPLRSVKLPFSMPPLSFYLKWHNSKTNDKRHEWMRNVILELFKK